MRWSAILTWSVLAGWPVTAAAAPPLLGGWETAAAKRPAQDSDSSPAATTPEPAPAPEAPVSGESRRDPAGKTGISPFWEAVNAGDRAYLAQDYPAAVTAYQKAVEADPHNPLGHLRLGTAQLKAGQSSEGETALAAALRFSAQQPEVKAKALIAIALLRESQQSLEDAEDSWQAYLTFSKQQSAVKTFPGTATGRREVIAARKKAVQDGTTVKERIAERAREADESLRSTSK